MTRNTPIARITTELSDLNVITTTMWYSGCKLYCAGCQNTHLKEFRNDGILLKEVKEKLKERRKLTEWLVHSGGNPIDSIEWLLTIAEYAKELNFKQFLFCGYSQQELNYVITPDQNAKMIDLIDYVKVGAYDETKRKSCYENCSQYFFETLNQCVIKSNRETKTWDVTYCYIPGMPISNWCLK